MVVRLINAVVPVLAVLLMLAFLAIEIRQVSRAWSEDHRTLSRSVPATVELGVWR